MSEFFNPAFPKKTTISSINKYKEDFKWMGEDIKDIEWLLTEAGKMYKNAPFYNIHLDRYVEENLTTFFNDGKPEIQVIQDKKPDTKLFVVTLTGSHTDPFQAWTFAVFIHKNFKTIVHSLSGVDARNRKIEIDDYNNDGLPDFGVYSASSPKNALSYFISVDTYFKQQGGAQPSK